MAFPQKKITSSDFRCVSHLLQSNLGILARDARAQNIDNALEATLVATNVATARANALNLARASYIRCPHVMAHRSIRYGTPRIRRPVLWSQLDIASGCLTRAI